MNFLYPRLGKETSPRLRLEWLPSGIISNQSLDLSFHHFNLHSFITPHPTPILWAWSFYTLIYIIWYQSQGYQVSKLPPSTLQNTKIQKHKNTQTGKPCKSWNSPSRKLARCTHAARHDRATSIFNLFQAWTQAQPPSAIVHDRASSFTSQTALHQAYSHHHVR